jgi:hypothetical protein
MATPDSAASDEPKSLGASIGRCLRSIARSVRSVASWIRIVVGQPWPELLAAALAALVVLRATKGCPAAAPDQEGTLIPFPGERFANGVDLLAPGAAIDMTVVSGEAGAAPQSYAGVKVKRVLRGATAVVLLDVKPEVAPAIQSALANEKTRFAYAFTASSAPTSAPAAPSASPSASAPPSPYAALDLAVGSVEARPLPLARPASTKLMIVSKLEPAPDAGAPAASSRRAVDACVAVAHLDKHGVAKAYDPAETKHYRVLVPSARLAEITTALASAERIFLLDDATCPPTKTP